MATANVTPKAGVPRPKKASQLKGALGINMLIFGYGGSGKTTLACTAQDTEHGRDVLLLDVDRGVESVSDRDDVDVLQPSQWKTSTPDEPSLYSILQWIKQQTPGPEGSARYKTVVFDSLTSIYDLILKDILRASPTPDMPSQPEYGKANMALQQLIADMRALGDLGVNTIFIAHAKEETDQGSNMVLIRLALTPGVTSNVMRTVDHVGYLQVDTGSGNRKLILKNSPRIIAKFRQPRSGPQLPLELLNPNMATIIEHVRKAKGQN